MGDLVPVRMGAMVMRMTRAQRAAGAVAAAVALAVAGVVGYQVAPDRPATVAATTVTVPASINRTCTVDVAADLKAFYQARAPGTTVVMPAGSCYLVGRGMRLDNLYGVDTQGNGSTIRAGALTSGPLPVVWLVNGGGYTFSDLTIRGTKGAAGATSAQWGQHGLRASNVQGLGLDGVNVENVHGDWVHLGQTDSGKWSEGVWVSGGRFRNSGRQGITMVGTRTVVVANADLAGSQRSMFDLEPVGSAGQGNEGVWILHNTIGAAGGYIVSAAGSGRRNNDVTVDGNTVAGSLSMFAYSGLTIQRRSGWRITNNTGGGLPGNPAQAVIQVRATDGVTVSGNTQPVQPGRQMVLLDCRTCTDVEVEGNVVPNGVGQARVNGVLVPI